VHWWRYPIERPDLVALAASEIFTLLAAGSLDAAVSRREPLPRAWPAAQDVAAGHTTGKVIIAI
jgi:NADPH:quinone reductase-like Zn-dependent oxidoreductase